jgi:hypothetical protein
MVLKQNREIFRAAPPLQLLLVLPVPCFQLLRCLLHLQYHLKSEHFSGAFQI